MTSEINLLRKSISSELTPNIDKLRMVSKEDLCYFKDAYMKFKTRN